MSKRQFKSQASSSRAVSGTWGTQDAGFSSHSLAATSVFGNIRSSPLSYVYEPPDLSKISEPNVVVALKNLQKKDSITKSKALEDIQAYVLSIRAENGGIEEAILEVWIKLYPRTSIDSARRVRQLAHLLQGQISTSCGKRIAKYMPHVVGSWLAGMYDNDKLVARAAYGSLKQIFASEEKMKGVWRVYQMSILEYAREIIANETIYTLSDERTTSPDDASGKYTRVVGTIILMVTSAIDALHVTDPKNQETLFHGFLNEPQVWNFASNSDPFVRRAVYKLASTATLKQRDQLDMELMSTSMLVSALSINQTGSALEYVKALALLTAESPTIWTKFYTGSGKKSATKRICHFLRKGSQGGPSDFWVQMSTLIRHLPPNILISNPDIEPDITLESATKPSFPVLESLHEGISKRDELRGSQNDAWKTYLIASDRINSLLPSQVTREYLALHSILPIINQYVKPSPDTANWTITCSEKEEICVKAFSQVQSISEETFKEAWRHISISIIDDVRSSPPEQSKNYVKSHDLISISIGRWYGIRSAVFELEKSDALENLFAETVKSEIETAVFVLRERGGKPYSAAAILLNAVKFTFRVVRMHNGISGMLAEFAQNDIPKLLLSPSAPQLIATLTFLKDLVDVRFICESGVQILRDAPDSIAKSSALKSLVSSPFLAQSAKNEALGNLVQENLNLALLGDDRRWDLVLAAVGNPNAPNSFTDDLLAIIVNGLSIEEENGASLLGLDLVVKRHGRTIRNFAKSSQGSNLLSKLLFLTESSDPEVSQIANSLSASIEVIVADDKYSNHVTRSMIEIINQGIDTARPDSLSIDSLIEQAKKLFAQSAEQERSILAAELLPTSSQWTKSMEPFNNHFPNPSISVIGPLGGAILLVNRTSKPRLNDQSIPRDSDGYSPALRMAWYSLKMIQSTDILDFATIEHQVIIAWNIALVAQLTTQNLSISGSNPLWDSLDGSVESEIVDFSAELQNLLASWMRIEQLPGSAIVKPLLERLLETSQGVTAMSYHSACAYSFLASEYYNTHSKPDGSEWTEKFGFVHETRNTIRSAALLTSAPESKSLMKFCNELLVNLTVYDFQDKLEEGLSQLVLINCLVDQRDSLMAEIPQQRLVFFVKHIISQVSKGISSLAIKTEILKILKVVLPPIKEIYDNFWARVIELVRESWIFNTQISDDEIPNLHASLRLFSTLKRLSAEESNDDLQDTWTDEKGSLFEGLLGLLKKLQEAPDESHNPRRTVNDLLARELKAFSQEPLSEAMDLFYVLASPSLALQLSAFEILHHHIPKTQEQVSLEKALENDFTAKLPEELTSLIVDAPSLDFFDEPKFEQIIPSVVNSYLLSWKLIFDHWTGSSYKVQADYTAILKNGNFLQTLLDFTVEILITMRTTPVNASLLEFESYTPNTSQSPENDVYTLLIHLYYLSLKYLPNLSKAWWRDKTSRQTVVAVEAWTEKYISPLIIASELRTISDWAPSQLTLSPPLTVKVSPNTRELTAHIPIDEQTISIAIRLPLSYPLQRATVDSLHRVAVDEKKWRSWLIATSGVINFSEGGGALIAGLEAWRKNVTATLKGQTECAICYSVVGADRQLPTKKCGTCKNCFHGSCLFRWFKSSNSSGCPLCRNPFHYG